MFEFITSFQYFEDSIQAVFKDNSSMILHFNDHVTYFDKKGSRSRLKIENCRQQDNIQGKLLETLKIASKFTPLIPSQIEYEEVTRNTKVNSLIWNPVIQIENGFAMIKTVDHTAYMRLNLTTFEIEIKYYQLKETVGLLQENQVDIVNNFIDKYNLQKRKPKVECQIGYTYRIISKFYSVLNIPNELIGPFFILIHQYLNQPLINQLNILFPAELIQYLGTQQNDLQDRRFGCYWINGELITELPTFELKQQFCQSDSVPPTSNAISQIHLKKPLFMMKKQNLMWFKDREAIGSIGEQLIIRQSRFWQFTDTQWEQTIAEDKYDLAPFDALYKHLLNFGIEQQIQGEISYYNIYPGDFEEVRRVDMNQIGSFILLKNGAVKAKFLDRTIVSFIYPPPLEVKMITSNGQTIKFNFKPNLGDQYLTNTHYLIDYIPQQYQYHLQFCIRLAEETFVKTEINQTRQEHSQNLQTWIESEMEKTQRFLITTGVKEIRQDENMETQIEKLLLANQIMMEKLNMSINQ